MSFRGLHHERRLDRRQRHVRGLYGGTGTFTQTGGSIGVTAVGDSARPIWSIRGRQLGPGLLHKHANGTYTLSGSGLLVGGVESGGR